MLLLVQCSALLWFLKYSVQLLQTLAKTQDQAQPVLGDKLQFLERAAYYAYRKIIAVKMVFVKL